MEFAVPNCLESATYDPAKSLSDARNGTTHHFQVFIQYFNKKKERRTIGVGE
jgi:hypothetical protein